MINSCRLNLFKITSLACSPFTGISRRGKSEETPLRVTCELACYRPMKMARLGDNERAIS